MNYQYVTANSDSVKKFRGLGTERDVFVNADPEGRSVVLREPSIEELKTSIDEYYLKRAQTWWDEALMMVCTEESLARFKKSRHPMQKTPFAAGFRAFRAARKYKGEVRAADTQLANLRATALKPHLPAFVGGRGHAAPDFVIALSLDEQLALLKAVRPNTLDEFRKTVKASKIDHNVIQFDFHGYLDYCGSAMPFLDGLSSVIEQVFEGEIAEKFRLTHGNNTELARVLEYLGWLNQKGWLLLNKKAIMTHNKGTLTQGRLKLIATLGHPTYWNEAQLNLARAVVEEWKQAFKSDTPRWSPHAYARICLLLKSTTIEDIGDFSPDLLVFNESMMEPKPSNASVPSMVRHVTNAIVRLYKKDDRYASKEFPHFERPPVGDTRKPREPREGRPRQRSYGFLWVIEEHPKLKIWGELFEEYLTFKKVQRADAVITNLNRWLYYLLTVENPPLCPEEVSRAIHIRNVANQSVNTYWKYVSGLEIGDRTKCNALSHLRRFFDFYQDKLIVEYRGRPAQAPTFTNPVKDDDRWQLEIQRKTHRYAFGAELLEFLQEILLDRDENGTPTLNWAKNHPSLGNDWTTECDVETKETVYGWWPGRAVALYVLLAVPLRVFQVRWLDEGIGDEFIYDFEQRRMSINEHPRAEKGRREGVFRMVQDAFYDTAFLGIYVNTNKTKVYDPRVIRGYDIPWPDEEFFSVLKIMRDWNRRFFPNPEPVTFADDSGIIISAGAKPYLPKFYPLFRDKTSFGGRSPHLPLTNAKIRELWNKLMAEAEKRLKEQGKEIQLVDWVPDKKSNNSKQLVPRAKFDLHSLRVSGITALIEKGIPVHIISEYIAGHSTIIMTLYYEKIHPAKVRELLLQAQDKAEADLDGCLALLDQMDNPESILVWNNFDYHSDDAISALRNNKGLWTVEFDGICPGTICEEGGPLDSSGDATAVPAGACGLCRYFVTGPAFLFGQMQRLNNMMYLMREKGEVLKDLRLKEIDLEDGGNKRAFTETRGRREKLERELKDAMREWHNRYRMFQASLAMLDEYEKKKKGASEERSSDGKKTLMPLLSANNEEGFKPIVREATNLGLVRQITMMHEVLGDFDLHKGPILEYEEILNTILAKNEFEALLLTIPKEKRVAAANMLGEFLVNSIGEEAVEQLYKGEAELSVIMKKQTRRLLDYIKSDTFTPAHPAPRKKGDASSPLVQIKGREKKRDADGGELKAAEEARRELKP